MSAAKLPFPFPASVDCAGESKIVQEVQQQSQNSEGRTSSNVVQINPADNLRKYSSFIPEDSVGFAASMISPFNQRFFSPSTDTKLLHSETSHILKRAKHNITVGKQFFMNAVQPKSTFEDSRDISVIVSQRGPPTTPAATSSNGRNPNLGNALINVMPPRSKNRVGGMSRNVDDQDHVEEDADRGQEISTTSVLKTNVKRWSSTFTQFREDTHKNMK